MTKLYMDRPIRVAQIMGKLKNGGVESVIYNYYKNIDHSKYRFDFYVDSDSDSLFPDELINMGARCILIPPYQKLISYLLTLIKCFKANKYDIVHVNMNTLSVFPLLAAYITNVPVRINHNHSTAGKGETKRNIIKYILRPFQKYLLLILWLVVNMPEDGFSVTDFLIKVMLLY